MSQNFKTILETDKLNPSRVAINENFETLRSNFEGITAPSNPVKGQMAYFDDIPKWYDGSTWQTMEEIQNLATKTELNDGLATKSDSSHTHSDFGAIYDWHGDDVVLGYEGSTIDDAVVHNIGKIDKTDINSLTLTVKGNDLESNVHLAFNGTEIDTFKGPDNVTLYRTFTVPASLIKSNTEDNIIQIWGVNDGGRIYHISVSAISDHEHDDRYYTESEIDTKHDSMQASQKHTAIYHWSGSDFVEKEQTIDTAIEHNIGKIQTNDLNSLSVVIRHNDLEGDEQFAFNGVNLGSFYGATNTDSFRIFSIPASIINDNITDNIISIWSDGNGQGYLHDVSVFAVPEHDHTKWDGSSKTVSLSDPTGGVDGDIWFKYGE
ncbi:MAG: hypothetical protein GY760_00925 [Deltaproteobacteria bacterium]|nr:hypothetical protein [Deltaproteobacteria bacterium]